MKPQTRALNKIYCIHVERIQIGQTKLYEYTIVCIRQSVQTKRINKALKLDNNCVYYYVLHLYLRCCNS